MANTSCLGIIRCLRVYPSSRGSLPPQLSQHPLNIKKQHPQQQDNIAMAAQGITTGVSFSSQKYVHITIKDS
jgi:hypothetical protein